MFNPHLIFLTDGDKQFDVTELSEFLPAMDGQTDLVIGWRRNRADPLMRKLNALGWKINRRPSRASSASRTVFRRSSRPSQRIEGCNELTMSPIPPTDARTLAVADAVATMEVILRR